MIYNKVDVRSKTDLQQAFRNALQEFGSIDFVINGAGIVNENNIEDTLHTNLVNYSLQIISNPDDLSCLLIFLFEFE